MIKLHSDVEEQLFYYERDNNMNFFFYKCKLAEAKDAPDT